MIHDILSELSKASKKKHQKKKKKTQHHVMASSSKSPSLKSGEDKKNGGLTVVSPINNSVSGSLKNKSAIANSGHSNKMASPSQMVLPTPPKRRRGRPRILKDYVDPMKSPMANTSLKVQKQGYQEAKPFMKVGGNNSSTGSSTAVNNSTNITITNTNTNFNTAANQGDNSPSVKTTLNRLVSGTKNSGNPEVISRRSSATVISPFTTPQRFNYYMSSSQLQNVHNSADSHVSASFSETPNDYSLKPSLMTKTSPRKKKNSPNKIGKSGGSASSPLKMLKQMNTFKSNGTELIISPSTSSNYAQFQPMNGLKSKNGGSTKAPFLNGSGANGKSNSGNRKKSNSLSQSRSKLKNYGLPNIMESSSTSSSSASPLLHANRHSHSASALYETDSNKSNFTFKLAIDSTGKAFITSPLETRFPMAGTSHNQQHSKSNNNNNNNSNNETPSKLSNAQPPCFSSSFSSNSSSNSNFHASATRTEQNNIHEEHASYNDTSLENIDLSLQNEHSKSDVDTDSAAASQATPLQKISTRSQADKSDIMNNKNKVLSLMNKMKKRKPKMKSTETSYASPFVSSPKGIDHKDIPTASASSHINNPIMPHEKFVEERLPKDSESQDSLDPDATEQKISTPPSFSHINDNDIEESNKHKNNYKHSGNEDDVQCSPKDYETKFTENDFNKTPMFCKDWNAHQSLLFTNGSVSTHKNFAMLGGLGDENGIGNGSPRANMFHSVNIEHANPNDNNINGKPTYKNNDTNDESHANNHLMDDEEYKKFLNSSPLGPSTLNHAPSNMMAFNLDHLLASPTTNSLLNAFSHAVHSSPLAMNRLKSTPSKGQSNFYANNIFHNQPQHQQQQQQQNQKPLHNSLDLQVLDNQIRNHSDMVPAAQQDASTEAHSPMSSAISAAHATNKKILATNTRNGTDNTSNNALYDIEFMSPSHLKRPW